MSHEIRHLDYHCSTSEKAILKDIGRFAYDPEETSGYHGNMMSIIATAIQSRRQSMI